MIRTGHLRPALAGIALGALATGAIAAPVTYTIDSAHTYPSFEADHQGISFWRGKFNGTSGSITLDKEAETGSVQISIDMASVDFGHEGLNDHVKGSQAGMFDVMQFPTATYAGTLTDWENGAPTAVEGELTMHGETHPVSLEIRHFGCRPGRSGGETCGADAYAEIDRADFGVDFGAQMGMATDVVLRIQIEAGSE
jgi:polyisoprenoid-binding protein YceI